MIARSASSICAHTDRDPVVLIGHTAHPRRRLSTQRPDDRQRPARTRPSACMIRPPATSFRSCAATTPASSASRSVPTATGWRLAVSTRPFASGTCARSQSQQELQARGAHRFRQRDLVQPRRHHPRLRQQRQDDSACGTRQEKRETFKIEAAPGSVQSLACIRARPASGVDRRTARSGCGTSSRARRSSSSRRTSASCACVAFNARRWPIAGAARRGLVWCASGRRRRKCLSPDYSLGVAHGSHRPLPIECPRRHCHCRSAGLSLEVCVTTTQLIFRLVGENLYATRTKGPNHLAHRIRDSDGSERASSYSAHLGKNDPSRYWPGHVPGPRGNRAAFLGGPRCQFSVHGWGSIASDRQRWRLSSQRF